MANLAIEEIVERLAAIDEKIDRQHKLARQAREEAERADAEAAHLEGLRRDYDQIVEQHLPEGRKRLAHDVSQP